MVLQRNIPIPIWGRAKPGAALIAKLGNTSAAAKADRQGKWMLRLPSHPAGGPYVLTVSEQGRPESRVEFRNILIGDVWLASGQSNMEFPVQQAKNAAREIAAASYPDIRLLIVGHSKKLTPQTDMPTTGWKLADSDNVKRFSAVAWFFARQIHAEQHVPIGVIQSTWGGTPVQAWTSKERLLSSPITGSAALANDTLTENNFLQDSLDQARYWDIVAHSQNNADKQVPMPDYNDAGWPRVDMPRVIKDFGIGHYEGIMWLRKKLLLPAAFEGRTLTLHLGHPEMNYSLYVNGAEICKNVWNAAPGHSYTLPPAILHKGENVIAIRMSMLWGGGGLNPPAEDLYLTDGNTRISLAGEWLYKTHLEPLPRLHTYQYYPDVLFNAMINPLIPFGIKGFLWYQGEANDTIAYQYRKMFPMMITDWRRRWQHGDLPFLFVQLPNFRARKPFPAESEWAELREAQAMALSQPKTAMACTIDLGEADNIHPADKQEVGLRLALAASKLVYGQPGLASGPVYKDYTIRGGRIHIRFTNIGSGLKTTDGKPITGFSIAGEDRRFDWADAEIIGDEVIVHSGNVSAPKAVRYAWADNPACNLTNSTGLPAVPFRTDDWPGATQRNAFAKRTPVTRPAAGERVVNADFNNTAGPLNTMFNDCVGAGRAAEGLRADWQQQLAYVRKECGFRYIRMHGLLSDEMAVYTEDDHGNPQYNFMYVDVLFDFLHSIGMKPFVELGFMPGRLASGNKTIFWWRGNVTPPKDYEKWGALVQHLVQHLADRYGADEVKTWYFEVWNEPNLDGFWTGSQADYFKLYTYSARAIKGVNPAYKVGGPATAGAAWEPEMIDYCHRNDVPIDFISTHSYGVKAGYLDEFGNAGTVLDKNPMSVSGDVLQSRREIAASASPTLELHYTEWSSSYTPADPLHDSYHEAAYVLEKIKQVGRAANSMSYWVFTDIFEEAGPRFTPFHGGFGLLTIQGIDKPAFYAYQFLARLGDTELKNTDASSCICKNSHGGVQALVWDFTNTHPGDSVHNQDYYTRDLPARAKGPLTVRIDHVPAGKYTLEVYRVGYRCNDAYSTYLSMGRPSQLTRQEVNRIKKQNDGSPLSRETVTIRSGIPFVKELPLRENDVYLLNLVKL